MRAHLAWLLGSVLVAAPVPAQDTTTAPADSTARAFFDCPAFARGCDFDFVRTEITFVNWVRNREDADVHILVSTQSTSGGREYTVTFIGQRRFGGRGDTLKYFSRIVDTDDEARRGLARVLQLGLVRYAAATPLAERIRIEYAAPAEPATARARDPWNYWFFRIRLNGNLSGEQRFNSQGFFGNLSANRVTEDWKVRLSATPSYAEDNFKFPVFDSLGNQIGEQTLTSIARSYGASALVARSLSRHWSAGGRVTATHSTRSNYDLALTVGPGVEYDVFPYSESTRRLLTLRYEVMLDHFNYIDTTIFDQTAETAGGHNLVVSLNVTQPWGSANIALEGSQFLHDLSKYSIELFGGFEVRVVRGLSLSVNGSVSLVRNQINLATGGASPDEVLLRRRELETSYRYFTFFGISYSFGSIYNNIVNPRFGTDGGVFFFF